VFSLMWPWLAIGALVSLLADRLTDLMTAPPTVVAGEVR
jgi:hypothetical protein